jgi:hypothetical protein
LKKKQQNEEVLQILKLATGKMRLWIRGLSPLIYNAVSEKARHELLMPRGRLTTAAKAVNLKHDPLYEFHESVYRHRDDDRATRLFFPAGAFKKGMMGAAIDIPGATKASIGRLIWVEGDDIDIYGVPQLLMSVTRSADMNRTPDIRTRAILPKWGCSLTINFVQPMLGPTQIGNLLAAAGLLRGIGDWRQEKGAGSYGQFEVVSEKDALPLTKMGRESQDRALREPATYDLETDKLLTWFREEMVRRDRKEQVHEVNGNGVVEAEAPND